MQVRMCHLSSKYQMYYLMFLPQQEILDENLNSKLDKLDENPVVFSSRKSNEKKSKTSWYSCCNTNICVTNLHTDHV